MNQKSLLLAAALAGVVLTANAFAFPAKDSPQPAAPRPIAASVVKPTGLPLQFAGAIINVEFSLDQNGQPRDIHVRADDPVVKRQLVAAFRQWRFESAGSDTAPSAKRFILPIEIKPEV